MTPAMAALVVVAALLAAVAYVYLPAWVGGWRSWRWVQYWLISDDAQEQQIRDALVPNDIRGWGER